MIIYSASKNEFLDDVINHTIEDKLAVQIKQKFGRNTPKGELRSWQNSLPNIGNIISMSSIPDDSSIALEYNIPYTSKRVDVIVSGKDGQNNYSAIIIELKQWESVDAVHGKDGVVSTMINHGIHEVTHPSYQAWSYAMSIRNFNADVQDNDVALWPCSYLHNYNLLTNDPIVGEEYIDYVRKAPIFAKHDGRSLKEFIEKHIRFGDKGRTIYLIDSNRLRPSKSLQDCLASMMENNQEFILLDTQKVINETIMDEARKINRGFKKKVLIVKGGPGTGKSVLAINLLNQIVNEGMSATYTSKNASPRNVYKKKLKGKKKVSDIDVLFQGSGSFVNAPENTFDVILADEAHRLNEKSGLFSNLGENQIKEIIHAAKLPVFFIDEDQQVTLKDIGTVSEIRKYAKFYGLQTVEMELDSQFRCSGSDGYLSWLDDVLDIRETANKTLDGSGYDFKVFTDPNELRKEIISKNDRNNKSRMVAGYCWNWLPEKSDSNVHDVTIPEYDFGMSWNLNSTNTWAIDEGSIDEIGCIHTCQGLEFDYVGVIIGDDLRYEDEKIVTDASKRAKTDQSLKGIGKLSKEEAKRRSERIIKNTYKVLMTRGMKGCYVYCTNKNLERYLIQRIGTSG